MGNYIRRRLVQMLPLLLGISALIFLIIQAAPGGPEAVFLENKIFIDPQVLESYRRRLGLDQPVPVQYVRWISAVVTGDFGVSYVTGQPVSTRIMERLPATLELMSVSFIFAALIALPLGIYSAVRQYSVFDYTFTTASFVGIAMPAFWFALILQLVFAVQFHWLPTSGRSSPTDSGFFDHIRYLVLPGVVLALRHIAGWGRYMRSSLLEVIRADFIRTARAKGLRERVVLTRHAVKNALIPVVSIMALDLAGLFSGAVVVESVFAWPGIGQLFVQAMNARDYPVLMGVLMMGSFMVVFFNLVADITYAWLDPRISYK